MELETVEVDVVVAGSGAAGMTAALTAAHLGLSVLVIEKTGFFGGESAPYVDAVHAMYDGNTPENPHIPAWLIFDQRYRDRYVFAGLPPGKPLPRRWYAAGTVVCADDLAGLAAAADVDAEGLVKTVTRFSEFAAAGKDEDFGRGDSAYDRYYGDPRRRPTPTWPRWPGRRSTRSRSCPATWAPRVACAPTSARGCSARTGTRSRGCTPRATRARR